MTTTNNTPAMNNVNTYFQNPEVSAAEQLAPLPAEIIIEDAETPRISPERVQAVKCATEAENEPQTAANEPDGATCNEATQKYYVDTYGTPEAAEARYNAAIAATLAELEEYNANPRKGGRYRKERMARLNDSAEILRKELEDVKRNMRRYMEAHPEITPSDGETDAQTANVSPEPGNADREREGEPEAHKIVFLFPGGCWLAVESCGEWAKDENGDEYWQNPAAPYKDPETGEGREYARIFDNGELQPGKWWRILTEEQRDKIRAFAESKRNTTVGEEINRINGYAAAI